jgi:hypothetical protein
MFGDNSIYAEAYCEQMLSGHPGLLKIETRLTQEQLLDLITWLEDHGLTASRSMSTRQKVFIFLYICGKGASYRDASSHFRRAISRIHVAFHDTLNVMQYLFKAYVRLPEDMSEPHAEVINDPRMRLFLDCIGAIDGTHVHHSIKGAVREATGAEVWRNRKGFFSQNVLAVCDFKMNFMVVHAGWEGSAHDATVLKDAQAKGLLKIPEDKYFVADAGYCERSGYGGLVLSPYQAVRYHLQEWEYASNKPQNKEELFNLRHAQLRSVVERIFGVFKNRFHIFDKARDGYSVVTQVAIIQALTGLHNFINSYKDSDFEAEWRAIEASPERLAALSEGDISSEGGVSVALQSHRRDAIAQMMWEDYQIYLGGYGDIGA